MLSRLMASSERTGVFGSWLSAQARNCRAHSWGLVFCRCAMETGCTCWSATCSIHCSRLKPRACASALKAASLSGGRLSVTVIILALRLQVNAITLTPGDPWHSRVRDTIVDADVIHQQNGLNLRVCVCREGRAHVDRKSTRLNSSHLGISYAVFCLKKKK